MLKKTCPNCGKKSFSATDRGKWYCPYCNEDLTGEKSEPIDAVRDRDDKKNPGGE